MNILGFHIDIVWLLIIGTLVFILGVLWISHEFEKYLKPAWKEADANARLIFIGLLILALLQR